MRLLNSSWAFANRFDMSSECLGVFFLCSSFDYALLDRLYLFAPISLQLLRFSSAALTPTCMSSDSKFSGIILMILLWLYLVVSPPIKLTPLLWCLRFSLLLDEIITRFEWIGDVTPTDKAPDGIYYGCLVLIGLSPKK